MTATTSSGTSVPHKACSVATLAPIAGRKAGSSSSAAVSPDASPVFIPTNMGVPTAPNETGVHWIIIPATTAASAGKPKATKSGTHTAAGVPKPAEPSMNEPNSHAMMMT